MKSHHYQMSQYWQRLWRCLKIALADSNARSSSSFTVGVKATVGLDCGRLAAKTGWRKIGSLTDAGFGSLSMRDHDGYC